MTGEGQFPKSDGEVLYGEDVNFLVGLGSTYTVGTTAEGTFPKGAGDLLYPYEANLIKGIQIAYSGAGFNASYTGSHTGYTDIGSEILGFVGSQYTKNAEYLKFSNSALIKTVTTGDGAYTAAIKYATRESGGSWADAMAYVTWSNSINEALNTIPQTYIHVHELSAAEKASGVEVMAYAKAIQAADAASASFTNKMTIIEIS